MSALRCNVCNVTDDTPGIQWPMTPRSGDGFGGICAVCDQRIADTQGRTDRTGDPVCKLCGGQHHADECLCPDSMIPASRKANQ